MWVYPDGRKAVATPGEKGEGKAHTEYRVNEREADIVRRIFRMRADGHVEKETLNKVAKEIAR